MFDKLCLEQDISNEKGDEVKKTVRKPRMRRSHTLATLQSIIEEPEIQEELHSPKRKISRLSGLNDLSPVTIRSNNSFGNEEKKSKISESTS